MLSECSMQASPEHAKKKRLDLFVTNFAGPVNRSVRAITRRRVIANRLSWIKQRPQGWVSCSCMCVCMCVCERGGTGGRQVVDTVLDRQMMVADLASFPSSPLVPVGGRAGA